MMPTAASILATSFAILAASPAVLAAASDHDVAVVVAQFNAAHIVPDVLATFKPQGLLSLNFASSVGIATVGQAIPKASTANKPDLTMTGTTEADNTAGGPFNATSTKYTAILMDGNYPGSTNPDGYNFHYLENDLTWPSSTNGNSDAITLASSAAAPVIKYAGPGPAAGSGPHRYIMMVFAQPDGFAAPASPAAGSGVAKYDLNQYKTAAKLTDPIVATYFTVEEGTATVSVEATSSVNAATVSPTAGSGSGTGSGTATASGSGASSSSTNKPNGAVRTTVGVGAGLVAAALAAFFAF